MTVALFTVILLLLAVLVSGLSIAKYAARMQEQLVVRLQRLTTLERRQKRTVEIIQFLEELDDSPQLLKPLYSSLKADLQRILKLDPSRAALEEELARAQKQLGKMDNHQSMESQQRRIRMEQASSLPSHREIARVGKIINEAMAVVSRSYKHRKLDARQLEAAHKRLRYLSAIIAINSSIRMANMALAAHDRVKALSCFRRAESILQLGIITGREYSDKQAYLSAEKEKIYAEHANEKGLYLLAAGE